MKHTAHPLKCPCKALAATLAAALQLAAIAAVPTEWQVRVGPKATVYQAERYHGDALALRATLTSGGLPLEYQGAARLYAQTNGMGAVWWNLADVTVSGNVLSATWLPEFDTGADVVDVFLGAPSNYQAHARIRFLPSPGPVPNALPIPTPVLDFAAVEIQNLTALTNGWTFGGAPGNYETVSNRAMRAALLDDSRLPYTDDYHSYYFETFLWRDSLSMYSRSFRYSDAPAAFVWWLPDDAPDGISYLASTNYVQKAISTNNAAFVQAVRDTPIAGADASDLSEIGEYGSYGTVGAAILALIAGLAALKRRMGAAETAITGKADASALAALAPKYPMVAVTPSGGTLTVTPYTVATYTAGDSAAAFTVAVGTGTTGKVRDCELVIDCTAAGAVAPTVTWPATFHPRTDENDFACEDGVRNVYYISEYAPGEFVVGGWQETTGGNA